MTQRCTSKWVFMDCTHSDTLNLFIFQLHLRYIIILVSGVNPGDYILHNSQSDYPNKSCIQLTPCVVIIIVLTVFPLLYFTSP